MVVTEGEGGSAGSVDGQVLTSCEPGSFTTVPWTGVTGRRLGPHPSGGFSMAGGAYLGGLQLDAGEFIPNPTAFLARLDATGTVQHLDAVPGQPFERADLTTVDEGGNAFFTGTVSDGVLVKALSSDGALLWDKALPWAADTTIPVAMTSIGADADGNVVVGWDKTTALAITKLSSTGETLWERELPTSAHVYPEVIAVGADGNVVVAGWIEKGALTVGNTMVEASGARYLVFGLDPSGEPTWVETLDRKAVLDAARDAAGHVVTTGELWDDGGAQTLFVVAYDSTGGHVYEHKLLHATGQAIALRPGGDLVIGGDCTGAGDFGKGPAAGEEHSVFAVLLTLDTAGIFRCRAMHDEFYSKIASVAVNAAGEVVATGALSKDNPEDQLIVTHLAP
ncbi:Hypothetical protein A7982_01225 [Minicystis rosea]|nr:Hypothetical protein A7982_01225 [Minicystis rosea]